MSFASLNLNPAIVQALTASGPVPGLSADQLRLVDGSRSKTYTDATATAGTYEIQMFDFGQSAVNQNDWSLQLYQTRSVLQTATYKVDLEYGSGGGGAGVASHQASGADESGSFLARAFQTPSLPGLPGA